MIAKVVKGWHLLFMGANGLPCYGIEVETLNWDPKSGRSHFWPINERSFRKMSSFDKDKFGLTNEAYQKLLDELEAILLTCPKCSSTDVVGTGAKDKVDPKNMECYACGCEWIKE